MMHGYLGVMKFSLEDIPEKHLARFGLERESLRMLPERTLKALLSGMRTSLMRFAENDKDDPSHSRVLDARLSLSRKADGGVSLKVHPTSPNTVGSNLLDPTERQRIERGERTVVGKELTDGEGRKKEVLVGVDPATGSEVAVDRGKLKAPKSIDGVALDEEQKKAWKRGEVVRVGGKAYRFDPSREDGISRSTRIKLSHSKLQDTDIAIDVALLASGLGHVILLEHIADTLLHTRLKKDRNNLSDPAFRDSVARKAMELSRRDSHSSDETARTAAVKPEAVHKGAEAPEKKADRPVTMRR